MRKIAQKRKDAVIEELKGTGNICSRIEPQLDIDEIEEIMLEGNYDVCRCGWWTSCDELESNDEEYGQYVCNDCVDKNGE